MKRALVVGSSGQDGQLLLERLSGDGCAVLGIDLDTVTGICLDDELYNIVNIQHAGAVEQLVKRLVPDEVYYLAAHHHASEEHPHEAEELRASHDVHVMGLVNFLEAIRKHAPRSHLFYAGSSQMFGQPLLTSPQDESTRFAPRNAYAITKVAGAHVCALYREQYDVHASVGILYNHESPLRGPRFVSSRITRGARQATRDPDFKLTIGSLAATVDWGYAPDYVDAMVRMVRLPDAGDYVIATGELHTVRDFVEIAFEHVGLDWHAHVVENPTLVRPSSGVLAGDTSKLRARTDWKPTLGFETMVRLLVDAALRGENKGAP